MRQFTTCVPKDKIVCHRVSEDNRIRNWNFHHPDQPLGIIAENPVRKVVGELVCFHDNSESAFYSIRAAHDLEGYSGCVIICRYKGKLIFEYNYRLIPDRCFLEFPAGGLDSGETLEKCARRELFEELSGIASALTYIGDCYQDPGTSPNKAAIFVAELESYSHNRDMHEDILELVEVPENEIEQFMLDQGPHFFQGATLMAWMRYVLWKKEAGI